MEKKVLPVQMQTNTMFSQMGFLPFVLLSFGGHDLMSVDFNVMNIATYDPEQINPDFIHDPLAKHHGRTWQIIGNVQELEKPSSIESYSVLFNNLYEHEKDTILRSFYDEELFVAAYEYPDQQDFFWKTRRDMGLLDDSKYMRSSLLTTKPILIPYDIEKYDSGGIEEYLRQNITPYTFESEHLSEDAVQVFEGFAPSVDYEFHPTQFVAIRQEGVLEETYGDDDPLHERPLYSISDDPKLYAAQGSEEFWILGCASPYMFQQIGCAFNMDRAVQFLKEVEQHFIDPFYEKDPLLAMVDAKMSMFPDFRPTHYSHLENRHFLRSELIRHIGPN